MEKVPNILECLGGMWEGDLKSITLLHGRVLFLACLLHGREYDTGLERAWSHHSCHLIRVFLHLCLT